MPPPPPSASPSVAERLAQLEARIARLEAFVEIDDDAVSPSTLVTRASRTADDIELEVGQTWFARFGIIALAAGGGFMLTLPYPSLPAGAPGGVGLATAAALFVIAHVGRRSFALAASYLRGAAMALFYCAVLRLSFFGEPALPPTSVAAHVAIAVAGFVNLWIGWQRRSPRLVGLALVMASATPVMLGDAATVLGGIVVLAVLTAFFGSRPGWQPLLPLGGVLLFGAYFLWAIGNPALGHAYHWAAQPAAAPLFLLLSITIIASVPLWTETKPDGIAAGVAALLNCVIGYNLFLVHTYAVNAPAFAVFHVFASAVYLWLAAALWLRHRSRIATFFYAMCAYGALAIAIIRLTAVPNVFVWLSVESVMVVATAIWFQSRFIVVTNFIIYVLVVLGYMVLNERETGVSIGFGLVALVSARVLNWQRHRLELKTELMRNAYLLSGFVVFPYALYHLVEPRHAALAWVGLAVVYYALNRVIRNQKYRLMGHATLLLTTVYLVLPIPNGMTPALRIASFLAVGAALLGVSLVFTHVGKNGSKP